MTKLFGYFLPASVFNCKTLSVFKSSLN